MQGANKQRKMCKYWKRIGTCPNAGRCRFAHGEVELRQSCLESAADSGSASRVLQLEQELRELSEREAKLLQVEEKARQDRQSMAEREAALLREAEEIRRSSASREASLLRQVEDLGSQLSRARLQETGAGDVGALSRALSGETSTASFEVLAASTDGFSASRILGRGGFGPVYRGEWNGQAVAIKRLEQVWPPLFSTLTLITDGVCLVFS